MGEFDRWGMQAPPQPGEVVLGCGHASREPMTRDRPDPRNGWQWFELGKPAHVAGPDGNVTSRWVATCSACLASAGGDVTRVQAREHWRIDDPAKSHSSMLMQIGSNGGGRKEVAAYLEALTDEELRQLAAERALQHPKC